MKKLILISGILAALPLVAQQKSLACNDDNDNGGDQVRHCEMREQTIAFPGKLSIDGGRNGGVSVKGWDQGGVLVRAKVQTSGESDADAKMTASQIFLDLSGGQVSAKGPESENHRGWSVSFEVFVPKQGDLALTAHNGGISIADVRGNITFSVQNGGVSLKRLAGNVEGTTTNGGVTVDLTGARWDGTKLDARTTNGGITVHMPENYSAHLEMGTSNGSLNVEVPMTLTGKIGKHIETDLGSGGPTVHLETTNGGVSIRRSAS